jgi:hypothetical protein
MAGHGSVVGARWFLGVRKRRDLPFDLAQLTIILELTVDSKKLTAES